MVRVSALFLFSPPLLFSVACQQKCRRTATSPHLWKSRRLVGRLRGEIRTRKGALLVPFVAATLVIFQGVRGPEC